MKKSFILIILIILVMISQGCTGKQVSKTETKKVTAIQAPAAAAAPHPEEAASPTPAPEPVPADCVYQAGDRGSEIKELQVRLSALGYNVLADGIYNSGTNTAVKSFTSKYNIAYNGYISRTIVYAINKVYENLSKTTAKSASATVESPNEKLYEYLSDHSNGNIVAREVLKIKSDYHNACVIIASEALRRIGVNIPLSMMQTTNFVRELQARGFKRSRNISEMKPGAIVFTTPALGGEPDHPSHVYIFMGQASRGAVNIFDNQVYDYGSFYHTRRIDMHYLNGDISKPKEAMAFFMYK